MGVFDKVTIYGAGPITVKGSIDESNGWRIRAGNYFRSYGHRFLNPLRNKREEDRGTYADAEIVIRDINDIKKSDVVLVYWPDKVMSNGTAMEIKTAHDLEKIIIFVGDWAKNDIWIRKHVTKFMPDLDSAMDYIIAMFT